MERVYEPEYGEELDDEYGEYLNRAYECAPYGAYPWIRDEPGADGAYWRCTDEFAACGPESDAECDAAHAERAHWIEFNYWGWEVKRQGVYERDKGLCDVCGLRVDPSDYECGHIIDRACGGSNNMDNLVVQHWDCNKFKPRHHTFREYKRWRDRGYMYWHTTPLLNFLRRFRESWPSMSAEERRAWVKKDQAFWRWEHAKDYGHDMLGDRTTKRG